MLHKTRGIVLRTVKYGETSIVATLFTELFGIQSYMVNGVRISSKKGSGKANLFQPAAILDLVVYHNELKNLQRLREFKWSFLYNHIFSDVRKNAVAVFMVELLTKCLKQPEANPDLFYFVTDAFVHLDKGEDAEMANFPLFFSLHLAGFFGFRINDDYSEQRSRLDLVEGNFTAENPDHQYYLEGRAAYTISQLLKVMQPGELRDIKLNHVFRSELLQSIENYYALHIQDFGSLKTLPIVKEVLG